MLFSSHNSHDINVQLQTENIEKTLLKIHKIKMAKMAFTVYENTFDIKFIANMYC